jgi:type I restriction enzyme R subunit
VDLGPSEQELAFYDARETKRQRCHRPRRRTLRDTARELVETVRRNVTIDWTMRETIRAQLRVLMATILRKHGYGPDKSG